MTNIEELKKKQPEYKESLQELVGFINSEYYFNLSEKEKSVIGQYRIGLEVLTNASTSLAYNSNAVSDINSSMLSLLLISTMTTPFGPSKGAEYLKKESEEDDTHQELTDHAV